MYFLNNVKGSGKRCSQFQKPDDRIRFICSDYKYQMAPPDHSSNYRSDRDLLPVPNENNCNGRRY